MASEREQSPHYIPELDPDNPASGPKVKQRFLWTWFLAGMVFTFAGAGLTFGAGQDWGLVLLIIGLIMLGTLMPFGF